MPGTISADDFNNTVQSSVTNRHPNIWKLIMSLKEGRNFNENRKSVMPYEEMNQQAKKCIIL